MASGSSTVGPLRWIVPRLSGRTIPPMSVNPFSGPSIQGSYMGTMKWIGWMSGTARSGRDRQKRCVWQAGRPGDGAPTSRSALKITGDRRWSCRFCPTPGTSATTSIPCSRRWFAGPDSGDHQQLRRSDRPARHDDLGGMLPLEQAVAHPFHSEAATALDSRRCARACRRTRRFGSPATGRRYAAAALCRTPSAMLNSI